MFKSCAAASALAVMFLPYAANAGPCVNSIKDTESSPKLIKCVQVTHGPLNVRDRPSEKAGVLCTFAKNRKFWTEKGAGAKDGKRWYKVAPVDGDYDYEAYPSFSEFYYKSNGKRVVLIAPAKGCKLRSPGG